MSTTCADPQPLPARTHPGAPRPRPPGQRRAAAERPCRWLPSARPRGRNRGTLACAGFEGVLTDLTINTHA